MDIFDRKVPDARYNGNFIQVLFGSQLRSNHIVYTTVNQTIF
jgi:hypothetical protein